MARYSTEELDYSTYGTALYGAGDIPQYRVTYLEATATDRYGKYTDDFGNAVFNRLTVFWQYEDPNLEVQRVRVLRSIRGFAIGHNDPSSVVLIDTGLTGAGVDTVSYGRVSPPTDLRHFLTDESVIPGRDYYYSIYLIDPGIYDNNDLVDRWTPAAFVRAMAPRNHKSTDKMLKALPSYMVSTDVPIGVYEVTGTSEPELSNPAATLPQYLAGLAWEWDYVTTDADRIKNLWNPVSAPTRTVKALVESLGLPYEPSFGDSRARALLEYVDTIHGYSGAQDGIVALAEALSGATASISIGSNLMLDIQDASFTTGIGHWDAALTTTTTNPISNDTSLLAPSDVVFAIDQSPAACASWSRTSGTKAILSASGVANSGIKHSSNFVRVTTSLAHGLLVGDVIQISGASDSAFNSTWIVEEVFDSTSYGFSLTGSTATSASFGRTIAPADTYANPFALSQGVPVNSETSYVVSFNAVASSSTSVSLSVIWYDIRGNKISTSSVCTASVGTSSWETFYGTTTSPSRARFAVLSLSSTVSSSLTIYLDKFNFYFNDSRTDPIAYEEPRTVTVVLSYGMDAGFDDRITRAVISNRVRARVRDTLAVGTPLIVRMAPFIRSMQAGIPTLHKNQAMTALTLTATADTTAVTWSSTTLPTGLSLNSSTGVLSGTPTVSGSFTVKVTATDGNGVSSTKPFTIKILAS